MKRSLPSFGSPSVRPNRPVGRESVTGTRAAFAVAPASGRGAGFSAACTPSQRAATAHPSGTATLLNFFILHSSRMTGDVILISSCLQCTPPSTAQGEGNRANHDFGRNGREFFRVFRRSTCRRRFVPHALYGGNHAS